MRRGGVPHRESPEQGQNSLEQVCSGFTHKLVNDGFHGDDEGATLAHRREGELVMLRVSTPRCVRGDGHVKSTLQEFHCSGKNANMGFDTAEDDLRAIH